MPFCPWRYTSESQSDCRRKRSSAGITSPRRCDDDEAIRFRWDAHTGRGVFKMHLAKTVQHSSFILWWWVIIHRRRLPIQYCWQALHIFGSSSAGASPMFSLSIFAAPWATPFSTKTFGSSEAGQEKWLHLLGPTDIGQSSDRELSPKHSVFGSWVSIVWHFLRYLLSSHVFEVDEIVTWYRSFFSFWNVTPFTSSNP